MANVTDNPIANAAAQAFGEVVDGLPRRADLSVSLPDLKGITHSGDTQVAPRPVGDMSQSPSKGIV